MRRAVVARLRPVSGVAPQAGGVWARRRPARRDGTILDLAEAAALPGATMRRTPPPPPPARSTSGWRPGRQVAAGLRELPGLPHRQERVAEIGGVLFVNDSKATNADSAARALASYDRVVWIAGGIAKEGGIAPLAPFFPRIARAC